MEDNNKPYIPNLHLELTPQAEIRRLLKIINEKNDCIASFKKYDEERKTYYRRFEQNYEMMKERFNELLDAINACDEMDYGTKEFCKEVVMRLYRGKVTMEKSRQILQISLSMIVNLQDSFNNLEFVMMGVGNAQKRAELLNELRKAKTRYDNMTTYFAKKMKELK